MRLFVVFSLLCGAIADSNDTLSNVIPDGEQLDAPEHEENRVAMDKTLRELFEDAVQAYLEEDWSRCIEGFNAVTYGYKAYKRMVTNCRQRCRANAEGATPLFPENIEDMHFYEKKITETLCLLMCNQEYREIAGSRALQTLPRSTESKLIGHRPYEHLHICYYQKNRYQDAANALFTFLVRHPDHGPSIETLKHYLTLPGVEAENVVNLEAPRYVSTYFKAVSAYENEDYAEAAGLFESSLRSYLDAEEECRFYCEGPFDQGWHPEFTSSIANHFAYCLKCKRSCSQLLSSVNGDYRKDMLKSHYDYLQFSYYKLGKLKAACAAVESYLLFDPVDESMLQNRKYYLAQPKVEEEHFVRRQEALAYVKRQEYELRLLKFISEEFAVVQANLAKKSQKEKEKKLGKDPPSKILNPSPGRSLLAHAQASHNVSLIRGKRSEIPSTERPKAKSDVYLVAAEEKLGGRNRFVADGFLSSTECEMLMQLASMTAVEGDGYTEYKSPHSKHERFEGITVGRVALMAYFGQLEPERLQQLLEKTEEAREYVERYFRLDRPLYFTYTHLVCRTALPDSPADRDDLSHQIHADNCILRDEHACLRENPAYTWRDYSAILYLNNDFRGGEFFFAKDRANRELDEKVSLRCGRMVGFSAGEENLHGVRGVLQGRRCALALWFTQDEKYSEYERILAEAILKKLRSNGPVDGEDVQVPLRYEDMLLQYANSDDVLRQFLRSSS